MNSSNAESGSDAKPVQTVDHQNNTSRPNIPVFPRYQQIVPAYHVMRIPAIGIHPPHLSHHHGLAQMSSRPTAHHIWGPRGPMMAPPFGRPIPQAMAPPPTREQHHSNLSSGSAAGETKNALVTIAATSSANTPSIGATQDGQGNSAQRNAIAKKHGVKWTPSEVSDTHLSYFIQCKTIISF